MRGLVALCLMLATAAFSGCVELVDPEEADVDAAAREAEAMLDEYQADAGHIAGTVLGADGVALAGALVDVTGVATDVATDGAGRFTFIDLVPGSYQVVVEAAEHLPASLTVDVAAGQFSRPQVQLEAMPGPEPYFEVHSYDGYADFLANNMVFPFASCYCQFEGPLVTDGLVEVILEGATPYDGAAFLYWGLGTWNSTDSHYETSYLSGGDYTPFAQRIGAEELGEDVDHYVLDMRPDSGLLDLGSQEFTAYLSFFYHEAAPEDYTATKVE